MVRAKARELPSQTGRVVVAITGFAPALLIRQFGSNMLERTLGNPGSRVSAFSATTIKRRCIFAASLFAAFSWPGYPAQGQSDSPAARQPGITVADDANGRTVHLQSGQSLTVRLAANATTGYRWSVLSGTGEYLGLLSSNYRESQSSTMGRGGMAVLVFTAKRAGTTQLKLGYSRPFEPHAQPARTYVLTVAIQGG